MLSCMLAQVFMLICPYYMMIISVIADVISHPAPYLVAPPQQPTPKASTLQVPTKTKRWSSLHKFVEFSKQNYLLSTPFKRGLMFENFRNNKPHFKLQVYQYYFLKSCNSSHELEWYNNFCSWNIIIPTLLVNILFKLKDSSIWKF